MNELQIFNNKEFGGIRVFNKDGEPWFVGKDVADILGYSNTRDALINHVDSEDKNTVAIYDGIKGNPNKVLINESGLYSLVLSSKLPKAKEFRRWVTSEVIPSIMRTGGYINPQSDTAFLIKTVVEQTTAAIMAQMPMLIGETVKAVMDATGDTAQAEVKTQQRKHRLYLNSKVDKLPQDVKLEVIKKMFTGGWTFARIAEDLKTKGYSASESGLQRYRSKLLDEFENAGEMEYFKG